MKHIEVINKFKEDLSDLVRQVEMSSAAGHFDINKVCEDVFCGIFKEIYGFSSLRNLNEEDKKNFPGIDLADDIARVAIQVSSDKTLDKVKDTVSKFVKHGLSEKYDRLIVYLLTKKQASYSQTSIDTVAQGKITFNTASDILDYTDLATKAATADPFALQRASRHLEAYMRGGKVGLAEQDFDPPEQPAESLAANIVELYFPSKLYIADVLPEALEKEKGRKIFNQRKRVREYAQKSNRKLPSGFEVSEGKLITFYNLEESHNPFSLVIDDGTVEEFSPSDFHKIDDDHERVFKSLLRLCLQHQLYKQQVLWKHEEGIFIFLPMRKEDDTRSVTWMGQKKAVRSVFERKYMDKDPSKVLSTRHFAFSVDFLVIEDNWYASITPNWFFSYAGRNGEYEYSKFGDKLLSGLKRMEKNRSVYDQFRFLAAWLKDIGTEDLFSATSQEPAMLTFGNILKFEGGRFLNESLWEPLAEVDVEPSLQGALGV